MGILPPQQPLIGITDFLIQAPSITESGIYLALKKAGKYIAFLPILKSLYFFAVL